MKANVGSTDKTTRIVIAFILTTLYMMDAVTGTLATILLVIAAILLITGLISFCPIYALFGVNTCPKE